jgi:putative ABC transport system permease protein
MLYNYLKIGFRNLLKNKLFSIINVAGMAISIASIMTIGIYVYDELKFDRHVQNVDRKFRLYNQIVLDDGKIQNAANIPPMIAPTLASEFPEVEAYARYQHIHSPILFQCGNKKFTEKKGGYADPAILAMFSLAMAEGNSSSALLDPNSVVISATLAKKYFGHRSALGESLQVIDQTYKVTGVFEDFSPHSHFQVDYFLSMETLIRSAPQLMKSWRWMQFHTYLQLQPHTDTKAFEEKLLNFAQRNAWPVTRPDGSYYIPHLMPMTDIHLYATDHLWDTAIKSNAQTIYILSGAAFFILIIAVLNFINLSTARAVNRGKEVGVRKVVGAVRHQLIFQFLSESVILALMAFCLAGFTVELCIPMLNHFTDKHIPSHFFFNPMIFLPLVIFVVVVGIAAGIYPAFYLSRFKPASILYNKSGTQGRGLLRMGLVVLQFILSFTLIIASFVASDQHVFLRTKDLGFSAGNVVVLQLRGSMRANHEAVKTVFSTHPNVLGASLQYGLPGDIYPGDIISDEVTKKPVHTSMLLVDHDYAETLGLKVIAGRDFSPEFPSDQKEGFILSESALKLYGFKNADEALGHPLSWHPWNSDSLKTGKIVGVFKDFHLNSLKEQITPVVLHMYPAFYTTIALRIKPENIPTTIAHLESSWKQLGTDWPFEYRFLDNNFDSMYKAEEKLSLLFSYFTAFTIFVACLGLFGLVVYTTTQRYKEIGIRKILGAETISLVAGLSKNYLVLMMIAFAIAIPISYYASQQWLQKFAYHIDITWLLFAKAAGLIAVISLLTVSVQSFKATRANPAEALKES